METDHGNEEIQLQSNSVNLDENALKYTCMECKLVTLSRDAMDKHVKEKHLPNENEEVKYSCVKCGHEFSEVENYNTHLKTHDEVKLMETHTDDAIVESQERYIPVK